MSNLKDDLDQYLLLQNDQKKKFHVKLPQLKSISSPLSGVFQRNASEPEANSWLKDTQDTCCPQLSRLQRIVGFVVCLGLGTLCMSISLFYVPVLLIRTRKFALLYTLGSLFFILSFCFLSGFVAFMQTLCTRQRVLPSITYISCLFLTLYCSVWIKSTALTILFALIQLISLAFMVIGSVPGGTMGVKFFGSLFKNTISGATNSGSMALPV